MAVGPGFHVDAQGNLHIGSTRETFDNTTLSEAPFSVTKAGVLKATSGSFTGDISGASGTFTGNLTGSTISGGSINIGSGTFQEKEWDKFISWLNGNVDYHKEWIPSPGYLIIAGDAVDGIDSYPGQEADLSITDVWEQYAELSKSVNRIPTEIQTVIMPGNHDAVRPAEPQPAIDPELQTDYNNTLFVGNPCDFSLHGVRVLSYHGVSIMDFVSSLRTVTFETPEEAMKAMIDRRHLAPSWGGKTPLSPEPEDRLVIQEIPDIFVTGHVHGHHIETYKGVNLIHSSTWQDQTDYQRMLGFQPKPCILTVVNLHTHATAAIPFV